MPSIHVDASSSDRGRRRTRLVRPCHPGVHEVLVDVLGLPLSDAELGILTMFRMVSLRGEIEVKGPLKQALEALLDLSAMAKR